MGESYKKSRNLTEVKFREKVAEIGYR